MVNLSNTLMTGSLGLAILAFAVSIVSLVLYVVGV